MDRSVHFTPRQLEIVELITLGRSNDEIAVILGISSRTVRAHCDALRAKLEVRRREIPVAYRALTGKDPFSASTQARRPD